MSRLLQISDPHFGTERPQVVEALLQMARDAAPDVVVLSGDITQRATRAQFAAARAFVDRLPPAAPVVTIPGNHDIPLLHLPLRMLAPYRRHAQAFGRDLEPTARLPGLLVLGLNTTRWWRHQQGVVSAAQIDRTAQQLAADRAAHPAGWRVVVTHQPLAVGRPDDARHRLHGHREALARWSAAGMDVVLGGHIHLPSVQSLRAEAPLPAPVTGGPPWGVQAGTAVSTRIRGGTANSVNLLAFGTAAATVERWDFVDATGRFACLQRDTLQR